METNKLLKGVLEIINSTNDKNIVTQCLNSADVQLFIRKKIADLGLQMKHSDITTEKVKKDKEGYSRGAVQASFYCETGKIRIFTIATDNLARSLYQYPLKEEVLIKATVCFLIAHELIHALQQKEGRLESPCSSTQEEYQNSENEIEANHRAQEIMESENNAYGEIASQINKYRTMSSSDYQDTRDEAFKRLLAYL